MALVVTPEGLPLAYEMMPGNTADKTTLRDFLAADRRAVRQGRAHLDDGSRHPDRGGAGGDARGGDADAYLVGTPRGRLSQMERGFLSMPWAEARDAVQVKVVEQDGELYVLARSGARRDKEQAMWRRRVKKLGKRLHELRQQKLTRDQLLIKLGAARKEAGPAV